MDSNQIFIKLILAVGLGALMGLERDDSWRSKKDLEHAQKSTEDSVKKFPFINAAIPAKGFGGIRTYTLISLLGSVAGMSISYGLDIVAGILLGGLIMFILISFVLNYFDKNSFGLTTEISIILNFVIAMLLFATDLPVKVLVAIAVIDVVIMSMKQQLRKLVSNFSGPEVLDIMKFILISAVILPFLPNYTFGFGDVPFLADMISNAGYSRLLEESRVLNPFSVWTIVVVISGINFIGYFLTKILGNKKGLSITGLLGGLISSTAVTQAMASQSKNFKQTNVKDSLITATALANMTQFIRIWFIALALNFSLGARIWLPMLAMALFLLLFVLYEFGKESKMAESDIEKINAVSVNFKSPFALAPALKLASLFVLVSVFTKIALYIFGESGFLTSSMVSAILGLDAITLNTANLAGSVVSIDLGLIVLVIAASVNLFVKMVYVNMIGDDYFKSRISRLFLMDIVVGVAGMFITLFFL